MALTVNRALAVAGLTLFGALALTTAFAKPPKHKTPPAAKADPVAGKKVYNSSGCGSCHKIGETGGENGPNLTKYAADKTKDAKWTKDQIQDPKKHKDDATMPAFDKIKGKDLDNLTAYLLTLKG